MTTSPTSQPSAEFVTYEIRLQGQLDSRWAMRLGIPTLAHATDGTTALRTGPIDQPTLHGLLQRVRDLGIALLSVTRIDPDHASL